MVRGFNPARLNKARQAQLRGDTASPTKNGSQQESAQRPGAQLEMFGLCPVTPTQPGAGSSVPSPGPRAPSYTLRLTPTAQLKAMSNRERAAMPLGDAHTLPMAQNGDEHLVNTLSERQVNELRVAFDRFDANGDGTMCAPKTSPDPLPPGIGSDHPPSMPPTPCSTTVIACVCITPGLPVPQLRARDAHGLHRAWRFPQRRGGGWPDLALIHIFATTRSLAQRNHNVTTLGPHHCPCSRPAPPCRWIKYLPSLMSTPVGGLIGPSIYARWRAS